MMMLAPVASSADASVTGLWKTEAGDSGGWLRVQIEPCGNKICGTIAAAINSDGAVIEDYEHTGKEMIAGMVESGPGSYAKGTIWAPDKDKTYKAKLNLADNGKLIVKGCVAFICRSQTWTRVN